MIKKQFINIASVACLVVATGSIAYADGFPSTCQSLVKTGQSNNPSALFNTDPNTVSSCLEQCDLAGNTKDAIENAQLVQQCRLSLSSLEFESNYSALMSKAPYQPLSPTTFDTSDNPNSDSSGFPSFGSNNSTPSYTAPAVQAPSIEKPAPRVIIPTAPMPKVNKPVGANTSKQIHWF